MHFYQNTVMNLLKRTLFGRINNYNRKICMYKQRKVCQRHHDHISYTE